jgi:hypothetical protein
MEGAVRPDAAVGEIRITRADEIKAEEEAVAVEAEEMDADNKVQEGG